MKLKQFIKKVGKDKNLFVSLDLFYNLQEILDLTSNFKILYGINIELDFKPIELPKGRKLGFGFAERLCDTQKIVNKINKS